MVKTSILSLAIVMLLSSMLIAEDIDVSGNWKLTMTSPRGERTVDIQITQDGGSIVVSMPMRNGKTREAKGTIKGNEISWTSTMETPRGSMTSSYTGTVDGDTMKGKVDFGGRRSSEWSAKRVVAE